ncbi:MAG: hypothetical protein ACNA8H_08465 [Anaerolineales bacterium]
MCHTQSTYFNRLYTNFSSPISAIDCGSKCAPYNAAGVPFCCDTNHVVPSAYQAEWEYLRSSTDLWQVWQSDDPNITSELCAQTPEGQVLIACKGHRYCQREFRALSCRSFPFFPYINSRGEFIGLSYYWEYEDRCWVISNMHVVPLSFIEQFTLTYEQLFEVYPQEKDNFSYFSELTRHQFARSQRSILMLHKNGFGYKISARSERIRRFPVEKFPKLGPYKIAAELPFPGEKD